jgi:hypothetical protein
MITDPYAVREELWQRVSLGYDPDQTMESCEDCDCDWLVLSGQEFHKIKIAAAKARGARRNADCIAVPCGQASLALQCDTLKS